MKTIFLFLLFFVSLSFSTENELRPFTTDGCSVVPDFSFTSCCVEHDVDYWKGGTKQERKESDKRLRACVKEKSNGLTGSMFYWGVRVGGTPYMATSYRWGYGWKFLRPYGELNEAELEQVTRLYPQNALSYPITKPTKNYSALPMKHGSYCMDEVMAYIGDQYENTPNIEIKKLRVTEDHYFKFVKVKMDNGDRIKFQFTQKKWEACQKPHYYNLPKFLMRVRLKEVRNNKSK